MSSHNRSKNYNKIKAEPPIEVNERGGFYINGKAYLVAKREEIINIYHVLEEHSNGSGVKIIINRNLTQIHGLFDISMKNIIKVLNLIFNNTD